MAGDAVFAQVKNLLESGLSEEAAVLARARETKSLRDADLHLAWADLLEELGLPDEVILELNLTIRDDPERLDPYPRLAEILLDQGRPHRAAQVWRALIARSPLEASNYERLGEALREAKDFSKAHDAFSEGLERTKDERFHALLKELAFLEGGRDEIPKPEVPEPERIVPLPHLMVMFASLFAGREGIHARQWVSPTGESGYSPVEEPFTPKVAENHILGNYTVGVYPVRLDNTVNFIAFDFDVNKFAVSKAIGRRGAWNALMAKTHGMACKLMDVAAANDVPLHIEDSGFKGRHAWVFLETPVQAGVAKKFAEVMVSQLPPLPPELSIEIFPKQGVVRKGGLGNLIKLPLGVHKRTGRRAIFLEPDGTPYSDQLLFLESAAKAHRRAIYAMIQRIHGGLRPAPPAEESMARPDSMPWDDVETETPADSPDIKPQFHYDMDRDAEFQHLMAKCPVIRAIVEKANASAMISREETLVLTHTLGHATHGPEAVNQVLSRCVNADRALFLKSRLSGHPMSCPKVRSKVPHLTSTVACNCLFDPGVNLYPTPVIHIRAVSERNSSPMGVTVDSLRFQNLMEEYIKLSKQLRETRILLDKYEERLTAFFEQSGVDEMQTAGGKLRIHKAEDGKASFSLEI